MNANRDRSWTQDKFFAWAEKQDLRYEFDGVQPVAMTGGTNHHGEVTRNLQGALFVGLSGRPCKNFGSDAGGIATIGKAIRYPDATVTCTKQKGNSRFITDAVVVFEVVSPSSVRMDHVVRVGEYAAVPTIRRYVIIESMGIGVLVMEREKPDSAWTAKTLTKNDVLKVPEVGVEIPVANLYEGVIFSDEEFRGT